MNRWSIELLESLTTKNKILIVEDEDELLKLPILKQTLEDKGFIILEFTESLKFRIYWEITIRNSVQQYIIIKNFNADILPDILAYGSELTLNISKIFKRLDYKAIKGLDFRYFDNLLIKSEILLEKLSFDASVKFLLKNIFNIDIDSLNSRERILAAFTHLYSDSLEINNQVQKYLLNKVPEYFSDIKPFYNLESFKIFLDLQWQLFLEKHINALNFEESYLHKEINYYFSKGSPIKAIQKEYYDNNHFEIQLENIKNTNIDNLKVESWFELIKTLAELKKQLLASEYLKNNYLKTYKSLENEYNDSFQKFLDSSYSSLQNRSPYLKPFVVSQILDFLSLKNYDKVLLLVIDGLNFWQWLMLEEKLKLSINGINFNTSACLAWIPTITAYSRQAIFKGSAPDLNKDSSYEKKFWFKYWSEKNLSDAFINYQKISLDDTLELNPINNYRRVGIVCNDIDEIMHGAVIAGNQLLYENTKFWLKKSDFLIDLIKTSRNNGFRIFITADHGSIEAIGCGNLKAQDTFGSLSRSKRYLKFSHNDLAKNFVTVHQDELNMGRINDTVYLKDDLAFYGKDKLVITHGGSHFWEVIVPFIEIL